MWRVKKKYISQALWLRMSLAQSNAAAVNFTSVLIFWRDHIGLTYFFASLWKDLSCYRQLRMFVEFTSHLQSQITAPAIKNDVFFEPRAREINFSRFTPFCEVILDDHTPLSCGQILHLKCHQSELDMQLCFTNWRAFHHALRAVHFFLFKWSVELLVTARYPHFFLSWDIPRHKISPFNPS
jgi:hypothetical protein